MHVLHYTRGTVAEGRGEGYIRATIAVVLFPRYGFGV